MKIINPSVEIMRTGLEIDMMHPEQFIEKVGRTCYKSEDKITDDSAAKFVGNLIKRGHEAMVEHWSFIFRTDFYTYNMMVDNWNNLLHDANSYEDNKCLCEPLRPYIRFTDYITPDGDERYIVSGNVRAWRDFAKACLTRMGFMPTYMYGMIRNYPLFFPEYQDWAPAKIVNDILSPIDAKNLVGDLEKSVHWDITVKFICDRGVSHELVRHRVASFAQESTRYCNYGLDKFDKCITVVEPEFIKNAIAADHMNIYHSWSQACCVAEAEYFKLLELGCTPQEARAVLPNSLKTEVIVTMSRGNWNHFFDLRCPANAHPDIRVLANMLVGEFESRRL